MRSGKGRHRRPRQAPAILVTAGVTSAGIATSLLGASGAQAVEASTWDRVAKCESGGAWSLNEENGYYGGLQLTLKTWEKYGGTVYAERPDLASRIQQIEVAEKILAAEGPQAWPACAVDSGLEEEANGLPDLELPLPEPGNGEDDDGTDDGTGKDEEKDKPGDGDDSDESDESDDSGKGEQPDETDESDDSESPAPPGDTSVPSPGGSDDPDDPDDTDKGDKGKGDDGDPADRLETPAPSEPADSDDKAGDNDESRNSDRPYPDDPDDPGSETPDPGPGSGKHRGKPDPAERGDQDRADRENRDGRHLVEVGDTLAAIAEQHELSGGWPALYETNHSAVGDDPNLILPGQLLQLGENENDETKGKSDKSGTTSTS